MERNEKFEAILAQEQRVRSEDVGRVFGVDLATRARAVKGYVKAKTDLYRMIDALGLAELAAYGEYRRAVHAEIERNERAGR